MSEQRPDSRWKRLEVVLSVLSLAVALGGLVYQQIQLKQLRRDITADALSLVVQADQVLASAGVQDQLRFIGEPMKPLVGEPADCPLSRVDEVALRKAATLLTAALVKQPGAQPALDRILVIARTLQAPDLLGDLERAEIRLGPEAAIRLGLTLGALRRDMQTVEDELARASQLAQPSAQLVSDMAWAYGTMGRDDEALALLRKWTPLLEPSAQISFDLASRLTLSLPQHPELADEVIGVVQTGLLFPQYQMYFKLLEHDVQSALGRFEPASQAARAALQRSMQSGESGRTIPERWIAAIPMDDLAPEARLAFFDRAIAACPSGRANHELARVGALLELGRCRDALSALLASDPSGVSRNLYGALMAAKSERRQKILSVEMQLADIPEPKQRYARMMVAALGWSLDNEGRRQRAQWVAEGLETTFGSLLEASRSQTGGALQERSAEALAQLEKMLFHGMKLDSVMQALRTYAKTGSEASVPASDRQVFRQLDALSRDILAGDQNAFCKQ
jgi:hypothetical protein